MVFSIKTRAAVAMIMLLLAAGCDSPEERLEKHLQRGLALVEQGETVKAKLEFRNVLKINRDNGPARFQLGLMAEQDGDFRSAAAQYRRVVEVDPKNLQAQIKLAQILMLGGDLEAALKYVDAAFALDPANVEVLSIRAAALLRSGDVEGAVASARDALALDPMAIGAHMVLLNRTIETEGPAAALSEVEALLAKLPQDKALNVMKLRLLGETKDVAGLETHLVRMIEIFPEEIQLRRALTQSYLARGEVDAAEREMRAIAARMPGDEALALDLARMLLVIRGVDAARAELEARVAAATTGDAKLPFRLALAELDARVGDADAAMSLLTQAAEAAETPAVGDRARIQRARLMLADNKNAEARQMVEGVLESDPDNVDALAIRATMAIAALNTEAAIIDLRRAQSLAPDNPALLALEARALERDGNMALAGERLAAAARVSAFAPEHTLTYARYLAGRGQFVAAEAALSESARRNPNDQRVLGALAEVRIQLGDSVGAELAAKQLDALRGSDTAVSQVKAAALTAAGRLDEGIAELEQVVAEDGGGQSALSNLVAAYVRNGERERAETFLDDLIARSPGNLRARALRAEMHLLSNAPSKAEDELKALIDASPTESEGYLLLARLYGSLARADDAEAIAREGLERTGAENVRFTLASILEQRGMIDEAIAQYEILFKARPDSTVVANNLASLLAEFRADDPVALDRASRVARRLRESEFPQFKDTYGWIAFLRGEEAEALRFLAPAAEALPNNPFVRYHAGRAYAANGQITLARENLEAALVLDPSFAKAQAARDALGALPADG